MYHAVNLLKAVFYTALIIGTPTIIATGGHVPPELFKHPAYQFAIIFVFGYAAGPVISDFLGHHAGTALFFPNRPNLGHPTISHIVALMTKRLYKEALEELRMLTEIDPTDFRAYKMLLSISAIHIPDRNLFDMFYRKGMQSLVLEEEKDLLKRFRDELITLKEAKGEIWNSEDISEESAPTVQFAVNRKHHREKSKFLVDSHSATLPPREQKELKTDAVRVDREEKSSVKRAVVPHHFHPIESHAHHVSPSTETTLSEPITLEKSGESEEQRPLFFNQIDSAIEHFVPEKTQEPARYKFIRPRQ